MLIGPETVLVRSRALAYWLVGFAAIVSAPVFPAAAEAGAYKMYSCNVPGHGVPVPSAGPWRAVLDGLNTRLFNACAVGGSFGISLEPTQRVMHRGTSALLVLQRPYSGPKSAIGIVGYRTWLTAELSGSGSPAFISDGGGFSPPGGATPDHAPWTSPAFEATNAAVYVQLYCSTGAPSDCQFDSATPLSARGIEVDLNENAIPSGSIDGGTLLTGDVQRGRRSVLFSAADDESGVARVELLMGGAVVATESLADDPSKCPHTDWSACPTRASGTLTFDTSEIADGEYVPALRVTDAAGNRRQLKYAGSVTVDSVPTSSGGDDAALREDGAVRLTAQFAGNSRASYTTSFGQPARVRGRLREANGNPISNARIVVSAKLDSGGRGRQRIVTTHPDGRFAFRAPGREPSRRIEVAYFGRAGSGLPIAVQQLRLRVRSAATLRVALRGIQVSYSGRVIAGPIPRGGKQVFVQGRAKGGAWQRFAARWSRSSGGFSGTYRLRVRRPGVKLQFRVEIPKQTGYPYLPRTGRSITKTVR